MRTRGSLRGAAIAIISVAVAALLPAPATASARAGALTRQQRAVLYGIARDTWRFYAADVDPVTHLPLDNLGPGSVRGTCTSAANIGVFLWAVVAARDLYDTNNGNVMLNPGYFAADPESWAARLYLSNERMSIH
jgi:hypothetical protein